MNASLAWPAVHAEVDSELACQAVDLRGGEQPAPAQQPITRHRLERSDVRVGLASLPGFRGGGLRVVSRDGDVDAVEAVGSPIVIRV